MSDLLDIRAQVSEIGIFVKEGVAAGMGYCNKQKDWWNKKIH